MSFKAVAWTLLVTLAFMTVLLFNYWAAYQPLTRISHERSSKKPLHLA
jgi:hypothetical protein